jgi:hypothetical protein
MDNEIKEKKANACMDIGLQLQKLKLPSKQGLLAR